jgi:hypothetical protein
MKPDPTVGALPLTIIIADLERLIAPGPWEAVRTDKPGYTLKSRDISVNWTQDTNGDERVTVYDGPWEFVGATISEAWNKRSGGNRPTEPPREQRPNWQMGPLTQAELGAGSKSALGDDPVSRMELVEMLEAERSAHSRTKQALARLIRIHNATITTITEGDELNGST